MFTFPQFSSAIPEIVLLGMTCLILFVDLFLREKTRIVTYILSQLALIVVAIALYVSYSATITVTFNGNFIADPFATIAKMFIVMITFFVFIYSRAYIQYRNITQGEYYVLALFSVLGMMVMVSSYNFLTIYLGLELSSFPLYAMVALRRDSQASSEAAFKFLVTGAVASAMLLYGLSLLYGVTGSLELGAVAMHLQSTDLLTLFGMVFIVIGLLFKLGVVPFHMWVPDVYHGAPASIAALITSAPKIAAFAIVYRLLAQGMPGLHVEWQQLLIVVAVLSMFFGNLLAIAQANIKRMFAYSSIAHMGYMLLGVIAATPRGYAAALVYTVIYAFMAAGGFAIIVLMSKMGFEAEYIDDFRGLNARKPWIAFIFLILLFSMAGVPPTAGFFAKLGVIEALIDQHFVWLAIVAVLFSIIGAFYYLRVIKIMYFEEPSKMSALSMPLDAQIAVSVNGLILLAVGIFPGQLINLCRAVF